MKRIVIAVLFSIFVCLGASAQTQAPIRVLCGGPAYTDSKGNLWKADYGYNNGTTSANANTIVGTTDPTLFHYGRWNGVIATPLVYSFPVQNGTYHVNLYFAETSGMTAGVRVFNVRMQGQLIFQNLDIFATAGANTAVVKGADIAVSNGQLQVEFDNLVQNPKINAIEIVQTTTAPELKMSFVYPDGTPVAGTLNYQLTSTQLSMGGSEPLLNGTAACYMFTSPSALGLSGTVQVNLNLQDTAGHTLWQINMALNPSTANLTAVMDSTLNVVVQKL
ncbi:MAG TPA: malectin domain-containing carbohydrate-binding protein [Candidatus Acidoferrum sp.]|nr:malectin domain-containing carbohydrate-binding protein [Candidatus Acidoferrum sp.]